MHAHHACLYNSSALDAGKPASKLHTLIFKWLAGYLEDGDQAGLAKFAMSLYKACIFCFKRTDANPCRTEIVRCVDPLLGALATEAHTPLSELANVLQSTYQRDRKISNTLRGDILQCLGQVLEAAPAVRHLLLILLLPCAVLHA